MSEKLTAKAVVEFCQLSGGGDTFKAECVALVEKYAQACVDAATAELQRKLDLAVDYTNELRFGRRSGYPWND